MNIIRFEIICIAVLLIHLITDIRFKYYKDYKDHKKNVDRFNNKSARPLPDIPDNEIPPMPPVLPPKKIRGCCKKFIHLDCKGDIIISNLDSEAGLKCTPNSKVNFEIQKD